MRTRGHWRRRQLALALTGAVVLSVASCGSDDPMTHIAGIPVREGHTHGPGTQLGDGFTVAEGSLLLGALMPPRTDYNPNPPPRDGWRALLLVTGDATAVFTAYARQAAAAGFSLDRRIDGLCRHEDGVLACEALASEGPYEHQRQVQLSLHQGPSSPDRLPVSHMSVQYATTGSPPSAAGQPEPCDCEIGASDAEVPYDWPALPGEGEPFEDSLPHQASMVVEKGSRPVAPRGRFLGLWSAALFLVTDDPEEVLDRYEQQQDSYDHFERRERVAGGTHLHRFWGYGGGTYVADVLIRPGRPTYLLIEHSTTD